MKSKRDPFLLAAVSCALLASVILFPPTARGAATIVIQNNDAPGVGFNDPTPVAPVGGNAGTTLGQQRLNVFQAAANIWGAQLNSIPVITVDAGWSALSCTSASAILGSAGPRFVSRDFPNAPLAATWYHDALSNARAAADLIPNEAEIRARFNLNLGQPGCLTGIFFYLGLDNNHGTQIDLLTVLLHELGHGLGFSTTTNGITGSFLAGFPSAYDYFTLDTTTNKAWNEMTDAERVTSALNARKVAWSGPNVTSSAPTVLASGTPRLGISAPATVAGNYLVGTAAFGPTLTTTGVTGQLMPVVDQPNGTGLACTPLSGLNALAVNGNIALVDRGICAFTVKVKNAQNAGAIGVVIADNTTSSPPPGLGGADSTITIPAVSITQGDGNTLKSALRYRSRTRSGVISTLGVNSSQLAGADPAGRVLLFTPNPFQGGSSVSHWDTIAFPNQLMEPNVNGDLTHSVMPPEDLTLPLLRDLGW